ncbi:cytochrome P450 [Aspergillus fischeri NRRL 181]|nr:benzoate 4-monooxygenase cytochrome P450 [Aspergillus fischeri NRRL 181]EAW16200.1 benzoate 4-monooxygenase cytochrome P450 [Aspergillus fischeri NRRL 181]
MIIYNYFFHPLARVPGPCTGAIFPFWSMSSLYRRRLNPDLAELHKKYGQILSLLSGYGGLLMCPRNTGPIVRVGPNQLSFATVEAQKMIYNAKPTHTGSDELFGRDGTLQDVLLSMILGAANIGSLSNRAEHKKMRKRLQPGFTSKALFEQESLLRMHMDRLLQGLAQDTGVIDLTEYFSRFLWDLIGDLSFGEPLVPEKHGRRTDTLRSLVGVYQGCFPILEAINYAVPQIEGVLKLALQLVPPATLRAVLPSATFREYDHPAINSHTTPLQCCINRQDGRSDFLTHIMGDKSSNPTELELSYDELHSNATVLMIAGYKTTETSLSALFYRLLSTPGVLEKLQTELFSNFQSIDEITGKKLLSLPYLNGCVNESLRLTPAVAGKFASRRSPGAIIEGFYVPSGTEVYTETYTMQRSPQYWHAPDEYRPERWFERGEGSPYAQDVHEAFKPFSSGPRACLGREMALQTLRLTAALLVYRFHLKIVNEDRFVWEQDTDSRMIYSKYHIKAIVQERLT